MIDLNNHEYYEIIDTYEFIYYRDNIGSAGVYRSSYNWNKLHNKAYYRRYAIEYMFFDLLQLELYEWMDIMLWNEPNFSNWIKNSYSKKTKNEKKKNA